MYTVLVISCHPDDMEIACAGTLLKCKERGDRVVIYHLSSGNLGHVVIPPDELRVMRAKEAERSAALGGFEVIHSSFDDLEIYDNNKEARDKTPTIICRIIRQCPVWCSMPVSPQHCLTIPPKPARLQDWCLSTIWTL